MKKLIPALALLVVSAVLMGTSTFAWFSLNNKVTVTGMTVSTKIGDSLLIAADELGSTAKKADNLFQNGLNQSIAAKLQPASTVDGIAYWYTSTGNVQADGDAIDDVYVAYNETTTTEIASDGNAKTTATAAKKTGYDPDFNENNNNTVATSNSIIYFGYVDYVFQIKATNTSGDPKELRMTKVNMLYNDAVKVSTNIDAFRVAVFAMDITSSNPDGALADGERITILTPYADASASAAGYQTSGKAISANAAPSVDVKNMAGNAILGSVTANSTQYFKVVVRMWLEGEDKNCNNATFLTLTQNWTLDLMVELGSGTAASKIGSALNVSAAVGGNPYQGVVTLNDTYLNGLADQFVSYKWFTEAGADADGADDTENEATFEATTDGKYYCVVTANNSEYRTGLVTLTAKP